MSSRKLEPSVGRLFGSSRRTEVLVGIALLEETYSRELARILDAPLISVQRIVESLELEGAVATRLVGRQRQISLNPRYFARTELAALLRRMALSDQRLMEAVGALRRRPRRKGKPL
ncbi:MAG: hypothetical protein M3R30_03010 [Candidatus Eremiobacteraeota bacterium]|nr:hypothetical protein [Candidatus Eremiobacteraeota bacterium]